MGFGTPRVYFGRGRLGLKAGELHCALRLEEQRDQGPCATPVIIEVGAKGLAQGLFFKANFAPVGQRHDDQRKWGVNLSRDKSDSAIHSQDARVDGVSYEAVRAGADQLMLRSDPHFAAPVAAEASSRPDCE